LSEFRIDTAGSLMQLFQIVTYKVFTKVLCQCFWICIQIIS